MSNNDILYIDMSDYMTMSKLRPNLFVGNYKDATDPKLLADNFITAVLNVAYELDDPPYSPYEIRHIKVGLMDNGENLDYMKAHAVMALETLLRNGEVVLVHCAAGISRSVYVACQALANIEQGDMYRIFQELRNERPFVMQGPLWEHAPTPLRKQLQEEEKQSTLVG
jgi:protein-tyrosine phosphatase